MSDEKGIDKTESISIADAVKQLQKLVNEGKIKPKEKVSKSAMILQYAPIFVELKNKNKMTWREIHDGLKEVGYNGSIQLIEKIVRGYEKSKESGKPTVPPTPPAPSASQVPVVQKAQQGQQQQVKS